MGRTGSPAGRDLLLPDILMERIIENDLDLRMCSNTEVSQCSLRPTQPFSQGK